MASAEALQDLRELQVGSPNGRQLVELEQEKPRILSQRSARTLINAADALGIEDPARLAVLVDTAEAWLRHRGVGTARRAWIQLMCLEWGPALVRGPAATFSRLSRAKRAAWLERRTLGAVRAMIEASAPAQASAGADHSSPGA